MMKELETINNALTKTLINKFKGLYLTHSENYAKYLLAYNSTKFMVFFIKLRNSLQIFFLGILGHCEEIKRK